MFALQNQTNLVDIRVNILHMIGELMWYMVIICLQNLSMYCRIEGIKHDMPDTTTNTDGLL